MEMTIDNTCEPRLMSKEEIVDTLKTMVFGAQAFERFNAKERETLDKAWNIIDQYEARLKADRVAIIKDLKSEIKKLKSYESADGQDLVMLADIGILFQQKINALK